MDIGFLKKYIKKENIILLILGGVLLLVIGMPTGQSRNKKQETVTEEYSVERDYEIRIEKEFYEILKNVKGAGECQVMITTEGSSEKIMQDKSKNSVVTKTINPRVTGVVILMEGAGQGKLDKDVTDMACALFGLSASDVKVVPMKKK